MSNLSEEFELLEQKLNKLISYVEKLQKENAELHKRISDSHNHQILLQSKNSEASEQIRSAIENLKSITQSGQG